MDNPNKREVAGLILAFIISLSLIGMLYSQLQETRRQANQQIMEISKRADTARAGELAGQSQLLDMDNGTKMIQSGLLAVESAKYGANLQADQALRRYLDLAALPIAKVSHGDNVNTVYMAYSHDGKYVASGGGTIVKVWEAQSGREVARMFTDFTVYSLAFSQDGNYVAAGNCSYERAVQVWDVKSGKAIITQPSQTGCPVVSFSPNGKYIAWEEGSVIRVWSVKSKSEVYNINCEGSVTDIAFSPNGQYLLSSNCNRGAQVFDAKDGREIIRLSQGSIIDKTIFSSDSKYIATMSDRVAAVWEANSGREVSWMYHDEDVNDVAFSPDGRFIVSGSMDGTARVWFTSNGNELMRMTHETSVNSVAFSPDGKYIVSGSYDGTARVWTLSGHEVARFADASITSVAFSPDGNYVATGGCESLTYYQNGQPYICQGVARVWEVSNGQHVFDIPQSNHGGINSILYSPINDNYVLTSNRDGAARIWDIQSGREVEHIVLGGDGNSAYAIFSPNGKYILTRSTADKVARVWDSQSGAEISHMNHADSITALNFSPDSRYIVSGSVDGVMIMWEAKNGNEISRMAQNGNIRQLIFSPNGKYVAIIDAGKSSQNGVLTKEGAVRIWEASSGHEVTHIAYPSQVDMIAFSTDSKCIVLSGFTDPLKPNSKGTVSIREVLSGREVANYSHPYRIYSILFTSDGKYLITGSADGYGTIVVWDMQAEKEFARILSGDPLWGYNSLSLSPDNRYLVAGGYSTRIWDLQSDRPQVEVRDELKDNITFITQSRYLQSKNEISEFTFSNPGSSKFSPNGRYILTTGCEHGACNEDHIFILYWRIEDLIAETCRRLPRNFTKAEWVQYFPNEDYKATCPNLPIEP